jgi:hypothetical protein
MGKVRSNIRHGYYNDLGNVDRENLVTDASNHCIIYNQFVHKNNMQFCNETSSVTTIACLIPDKSNVRVLNKYRDHTFPTNQQTTRTRTWYSTTIPTTSKRNQQYLEAQISSKWDG